MAALRVLFMLALVCPAVGLKGFLDSLIYGHSHERDHSRSQKNVGRTVMDAIRLAMKVGSSERPAPRVVQVFNKYDHDGSNTLTSAESAELLQGLGFTVAEIAQMQVEMDTGRDGKVTLQEFEDYIATPDQDLPAATPAPVQLEDRPPAVTYTLPDNVKAAPAPAPATAMLSAEPEPVEPPAPVAQAPPRAAEPLPPAVVKPEQPSPPPRASSMEPFGREEVARTIQDRASRTQDTLVDAFETAQLAEIKSTVFRALTRLRTAHIKEYDTIARLETQAIDDYNDRHSYRRENPIRYMSDYEGPVQGDKMTSFH